ncbi:unnamed protein product [Protopolystoma xenopodis]|uniref:Uncharacterized protein n=1 Tax=Protopolystoma xenopodis TaxID=117903 RepID=A0A3S5B231_9PLAT|nr:unnamed protein product [Protopolystoma xenopodis]
MPNSAALADDFSPLLGCCWAVPTHPPFPPSFCSDGLTKARLSPDLFDSSFSGHLDGLKQWAASTPSRVRRQARLPCPDRPTSRTGMTGVGMATAGKRGLEPWRCRFEENLALLTDLTEANAEADEVAAAVAAVTDDGEDDDDAVFSLSTILEAADRPEAVRFGTDASNYAWPLGNEVTTATAITCVNVTLASGVRTTTTTATKTGMTTGKLEVRASAGLGGMEEKGGQKKEEEEEADEGEGAQEEEEEEDTGYATNLRQKSPSGEEEASETAGASSDGPLSAPTTPPPALDLSRHNSVSRDWLHGQSQSVACPGRVWPAGLPPAPLEHGLLLLALLQLANSTPPPAARGGRPDKCVAPLPPPQLLPPTIAFFPPPPLPSPHHHTQHPPPPPPPLPNYHHHHYQPQQQQQQQHQRVCLAESNLLQELALAQLNVVHGFVASSNSASSFRPSERPLSLSLSLAAPPSPSQSGQAGYGCRPRTRGMADTSLASPDDGRRPRDSCPADATQTRATTETAAVLGFTGSPTATATRGPVIGGRLGRAQKRTSQDAGQDDDDDDNNNNYDSDNDDDDDDDEDEDDDEWTGDGDREKDKDRDRDRDRDRQSSIGSRQDASEGGKEPAIFYDPEPADAKQKTREMLALNDPCIRFVNDGAAIRNPFAVDRKIQLAHLTELLYSQLENLGGIGVVIILLEVSFCGNRNIVESR